MAPVPADVILSGLRDDLAALADESEAMIVAADEEGRELTDTELETIEANTEESKKIARQIQVRESAAGQVQGVGRRTEPEPTIDGPGQRLPARPRGLDHARQGFETFGAFAAAVHAASKVDRDPTSQALADRVFGAATTYGNEGTGVDGGFAVPPEFRQEIWQKVTAEDALMGRCDNLTTSKNSYVVPKDETTPWQTSGGIQVYWESEAGTITQSKPALEMNSLRLNKLTALVPVSEELLEDAPGLDSYLRAKAPVKMASKVDTAIVRGTGAGQPLGILNSPSLISVAKEAGQAADTILFANISKMWSRCYARSRRNAVWLINQDIEPQLDNMAFDEGATDRTPVYLPANSVSGSPFSILKGRPVIPVEPCSTLGDLGDIFLVDLSQYMMVTKGNNIQVDVSMHLYFDQAALAYRFIFRLAGEPWWGSTIAPQFGSSTRSWAVTLAERA
jgi:HK97 family phage major capsid protein